MFPLEIVTMLGSAVMGGLMKLWAMRNQNEALKHQQYMDAIKGLRAERQEIRSSTSRGFTWTRRVIALSVVFSVIILPKLAAVFSDTMVAYGWTAIDPGFWFFTGDKEVLEWHMIQANTIVLTPLDTHTVSAIIGLYFGGSIVGHK
jgi:hypothetical protein